MASSFFFLKHLALLLLLTSFAASVAAEVNIGAFRTRQHRVAGQVVALSERVLEVRNFEFDGNAPAAFFWADTSTSPSDNGRLLLDGSPSLNCGTAKLPAANGQMTYRIEFPEGTSVLDYLGGSISVWCEQFSANFGEVVIPSSLEGLDSTVNGPALECSENPVPDFVATPDGYNCEPLNDDFQVRWQVAGDNLNVELIGRIDESVYMSFGVSGSDTETNMVGCDAVVADLFNDEYRAMDYYMNSRGQCTNGNGVCPDDNDTSALTSDTSNVSGDQGADLTVVRYTRPLVPTDVAANVQGQTVDRTIDVTAGVSTFVVWALGPIDDDSGLAFFHSIDYPRDDVSIEFGRSVVDNCEPLMMDDNNEPEEEAEAIPFYRPIMTDVTEFTAHIGPSGGDRGYVAITEQDAWGISWYLNDAIIPLIEMRRGTTYRFLVNGGDDVQQNSEYHPLYLTDSLEGGIAQFFPDVTETIYAGVTISEDGTSYTATAEGPLCDYDGTEDTQAAMEDGTNFPQYFETLDTSCASNTTLSAAAGVLEFTPDANTPDLLYYQCVTHRSLGWEVHVIDADAPSLLDVDCSGFRENTIELRAGVTLNTIVNPQTNTLQAEVIYEGLAWVALAFTANQTVMVGAESVIGLPDDDTVLKYTMTAQAPSAVNPRPAAQQTLQDASIVQNETHTVLSFTKLLIEPGEHPIDLEKPNTFLWAVGTSNTLGFHAGPGLGRGGTVVTTAQCKVTFNGEVQNANFLQSSGSAGGEKNTRSLWAAHGGCAATAWAILVPLAIGSSLIRKTLEGCGLPPGMWFQLHRGLNTLAALLTVCAFGIAVYIFNDAGRDQFSGDRHFTVGLVIFILTLVQAMNGIFRPHLPPSSNDKDAGDEEEDVKEEAASSEKSKPRVFWEYGHRILGVVILAMAWWQVQSGFGLFATLFETDLRAAFWGVVGAITAVVVLVKVYQIMVQK